MSNSDFSTLIHKLYAFANCFDSGVKDASAALAKYFDIVSGGKFVSDTSCEGGKGDIVEFNNILFTMDYVRRHLGDSYSVEVGKAIFIAAKPMIEKLIFEICQERGSDFVKDCGPELATLVEIPEFINKGAGHIVRSHRAKDIKFEIDENCSETEKLLRRIAYLNYNLHRINFKDEDDIKKRYDLGKYPSIVDVDESFSGKVHHSEDEKVNLTKNVVEDSTYIVKNKKTLTYNGSAPSTLSRIHQYVDRNIMRFLKFSNCVNFVIAGSAVSGLCYDLLYNDIDIFVYVPKGKYKLLESLITSEFGTICPYDCYRKTVEQLEVGSTSVLHNYQRSERHESFIFVEIAMMFIQAQLEQTSPAFTMNFNWKKATQCKIPKDVFKKPLNFILCDAPDPKLIFGKFDISASEFGFYKNNGRYFFECSERAKLCIDNFNAFTVDPNCYEMCCGPTITRIAKYIRRGYGFIIPGVKQIQTDGEHPYGCVISMIKNGLHFSHGGPMQGGADSSFYGTKEDNIEYVDNILKSHKRVVYTGSMLQVFFRRELPYYFSRNAEIVFGDCYDVDKEYVKYTPSYRSEDLAC